MTSCTYNCLMSVINIGNSIIGVSILAMPYCFRKCGILLSVILIFISGLLTRLACYLLLKSAIMARRRNFEFLAFHILGYSGKLAVEISVIGFLIGVCIAFFVVIGDLGPPLAAEFLNIENSSNLRSNVLVLVGICVALPLGLLRKIDSLTSLSALSIAFYICLILKIFAEAVPNLANNEWWYAVNWWQTDGLLPCLPIFSMALSCQTQLFEFFDTLNDPSIKRMQSVVGGAVHLCSVVYIMVGTLGYIAFHDKTITGNILVLLTPSVITEFIKFGFILTIAVSFPLCLFPCRSSLHSLLFKQGFGHHELNVTVIPEVRFRVLTVSLIMVTIGIAIMLPNIEFVLGIIGSTIGTLICLIFPAVIFIQDTSKNTTEKRLAQILMGVGAFILIACTYSTLHEAGTRPVNIPEEIKIENLMKITPALPVNNIIASSMIPDVQSPAHALKDESGIVKEEIKEKIEIVQLPDSHKRLEPPVPQEPEIKAEQHADLDPQALQKEDKELQKNTIPLSSNTVEPSKADDNIDKQEKLLQKLEEQQKEQKIILENQKKILEELKMHKESHEEQRRKENKKQANPEPDAKIPEEVAPLKSDSQNLNKIPQKEPLPLLHKAENSVNESPVKIVPKRKDAPKIVVNGSDAVLIPNKDTFTQNVQNKDIPKEGFKFEIRVENTAPSRLVKNETLVRKEQDIKVIPREEVKVDDLKPPTSTTSVHSEKQTSAVEVSEVGGDAHINQREPLSEKKVDPLEILQTFEKNVPVQDILSNQKQNSNIV